MKGAIQIKFIIIVIIRAHNASPESSRKTIIFKTNKPTKKKTNKQTSPLMTGAWGCEGDGYSEGDGVGALALGFHTANFT